MTKIREIQTAPILVEAQGEFLRVLADAKARVEAGGVTALVLCIQDRDGTVIEVGHGGSNFSTLVGTMVIGLFDLLSRACNEAEVEPPATS